MTWILGAAYILNQDKKHISGRIKLLFQPAEEGLAGAKLMIEHGVLNDVDIVIGGHVWPSLPYKTLGIKSGPMMASSSKFKIKILGKGGHGAAPHETIDPIMVASQIYQSLQTIRSRVMNPTHPGVVSVTQFHSGSSHNIIPDTAFLSGTVRTLNQEDVQLVKDQMHQIVQGIALGHNASYEFDFDNYYPILNNDQALTYQVMAQAKQYFDHLEVMTWPAMAGEDFSFYANIKPSVFFFLGSSISDQTHYPLHHPKFDVDEKILLYGSQWYAKLATNL
jgi:amidohydrolase